MPDAVGNIKGIAVPDVPWHQDCVRCAGSGWVGDKRCPRCEGRGTMPKAELKVNYGGPTCRVTE